MVALRLLAAALMSPVTFLRNPKRACVLKKKKKEKLILTLEEPPLCIISENVTFKSLWRM